MSEDKEEKIISMSASCRDCTNQYLFSLINKLVYAIIGLSVLNSSPEVFKAIMGLIK